MELAAMVLALSYPDISEAEILAAVDCLRSGWLTSGKNVYEFEQAFIESLGSYDPLQAVAVNSCTNGLYLALKALDVGPGDEVITTPYTFTATAAAIERTGATPVFADVNSRTMNIDPNQIEAAITARTRAIVPVHLNGLACEMDDIWNLADQHEAVVVEDAAHALPSWYGIDRIGSLSRSDATVFSFYATKGLTTGGEGGMITTRQEEVARRCRLMRLHGIDRDAYSRDGWRYEVVTAGEKCNMSDLSAAIGLAQLGRMYRTHRLRVEVAEIYDRELIDLPLTLPAREVSNRGQSWHLYSVLLDDYAPMNRDDTIAKLRELGVPTGVHYVPLHRHRYWRDKYGLTDEMFPIATALFERQMSLPMHSRLDDDDLEKIVNGLRDVLRY